MYHEIIILLTQLGVEHVRLRPGSGSAGGAEEAGQGPQSLLEYGGIVAGVAVAAVQTNNFGLELAQDQPGDEFVVFESWMAETLPPQVVEAAVVGFPHQHRGLVGGMF